MPCGAIPANFIVLAQLGAIIGICIKLTQLAQLLHPSMCHQHIPSPSETTSCHKCCKCNCCNRVRYDHGQPRNLKCARVQCPSVKVILCLSQPLQKKPQLLGSLIATQLHSSQQTNGQNWAYLPKPLWTNDQSQSNAACAITVENTRVDTIPRVDTTTNCNSAILKMHPRTMHMDWQ